MEEAGWEIELECEIFLIPRAAQSENILLFVSFSQKRNLSILTSGLITFSINTQVIIQNRAFSLARYLGLSADNHLDGQNGCQESFCHCK